MSVAAKLHKVMGSVSYLAHDSRMETGPRYSYLSEEALVTALHAAFVEHGLTIVPVGYQIISERIDTLSNDKLQHVARVLATFRFTDPEDGDSVDIQSLGEGADIGDKVLNKCMTAAYKYALRQSCMIATGEDPDHTASTQSKGSQPSGRGNGNGNGNSPSESQLNYLKTLINERDASGHGGQGALLEATIGRKAKVSEMTRQEVSSLIEVWKNLPKAIEGKEEGMF